MSVNLSLFAGAGWQFFDNNGVPLAGGLIYTYAAGTTTPQATYTSSSGTIAQSNPIVLNSAGRVAVGEVWVSEGVTYKFVLKDSTETTIGTYDNINSTYVASDLANTTDPTLGDALVGFRQSTPAGNAAGAVGRTVHQKFQETVSVLDFGADPSGVADSLAAFQAAIASFPTTYDSGVGSKGGTVLVPPGNYYLSGTLELNRSVNLKGATGAYAGYGASTLTFADNVTGIWCPYYTTSSNGKMGPGLIIENLVLNRKTTSGTLGHGILIEVTCVVRNCSIAGFRENGIFVQTGASTPNANDWYIETTSCISNGSHGVYISGDNANAGIALGVYAGNNGGYGFYDHSFLGNTYVACTSETNTLSNYYVFNVSFLLGCYSEPGSPADYFNHLATIFGGLIATAPTGNTFGGDNNGSIVARGVQAPYITLGYGQSVSSGNGIVLTPTNGTYPGGWAYGKTLGRWGWNYANLGVGTIGALYDTAATPANGYARDISSLSSPTGGYGASGVSPYYFGNYNQMLYRGLGTAAPSSGDYLAGDIIYHSAPSAGGYIGWVCTTAGNPGTWKTFGAISA